MLKRILIHATACVLLGTSAWCKVLVRWTQPTLPSQSLGAIELVIPFAPDKLPEINTAFRQGYRVYVEVPLQQFADAEKLLGKNALVGFIIEPENAQDTDKLVQKLHANNPKLTIRLLSRNGKQPQMRGQTVTTRNGVLQVSSPTAQPWLDSNLAMVRFEQSSHPGATPTYSFAWELTDSLQQENGPGADDYKLAIAESGALHADLVLPLHPSLEKGLLENQPGARATWNKILSCIKFASARTTAHMAPWSNIAIIGDNYDAAYEPMNLMARHNIPFRVIPRITGRSTDGLKVAVALTSPDQQDAEALNSFADHGGSVIVVDAKGKYPWQSVQPVQTAESGVSYKVGKGQIFELSEPISDPEAFAEDVRRLTPKNDVLISLWNALTTIAVPYRDDRTGDVAVEFINFAQEPMRIQGQLKGSYSSIRYETPDHGCCQDLTPVKHYGFTDFIVPSLVIAGRVHLKPRVASTESKQK
jgi:hypothetical protein